MTYLEPHGSGFMSKYHDRIAARVERKYFTEARTGLLGPIEGKVLEVGIGTGVNLPFLTSAKEIVGIEPDAGMRVHLDAKIPSAPAPVTVVDGVAERLPFGAGEFDAVVATLVLCEVTDLDQALAEIRRVLVPGGVLVFLEHVRDAGLRGLVQDLVTPLSKRVLLGCRPNRNTLDAMRDNGFTVSIAHWIPRPRPRPPANGPYFAGTATVESS
ncbi:class I SAM-dependent methyltransferase [Actinokineospora xionganensis]|uniref:Class I SAM-dependent methyltransferase n=1 Tax=Actinokineospora xionganensis TaxID=2684470 RepID=A0ABR7KZV3_9PSEU|nr:class I SAM-dependent methyltransferase [Actinokineospora xionganensis]MBC6445963.1 class I SAM-dependent methyltransferase [Actinokineospora xionganensis]